jgi:hypothetical protein
LWQYLYGGFYESRNRFHVGGAMTKKDFVIAWLLASQAGGKATTRHTDALIEQAEELWELMEKRYE